MQMNISLRSATGFVALVVATMVSANEVNAQSNYTFNTGWYVQPSQQHYQGIQTAAPTYHFGSPIAQTYSPQPYEVYQPPGQRQNLSWTPQVTAPTVRTGVTQTFSSPTYSRPLTTYSQAPTVRLAPLVSASGGAAGCSSGT